MAIACAFHRQGWPSGHERSAPRGLVGHLRQIHDVDMHEARLIVSPAGEIGFMSGEFITTELKGTLRTPDGLSQPYVYEEYAAS